MGLINRFMTAFNAGVSAFRQDYLIPVRELGYDSDTARLYRYQIWDGYYNNSIYSNLSNSTHLAARKIEKKLYKRIRPIRNPSHRIVEAYVAKTYGGEIDFDNLTTGALPISNADDALRAAFIQTLIWSNWRTNKSLFVRQGANYGNAFLKIVDDTVLGRARMEILHPGKVRDLQKDGAGNIERILIEYERDENASAYLPNDSRREQEIETYLYTEIITPDSFSTFKDGKPFAYYANGNGERVTEWANPYGFVPVAPAVHKDSGLLWGMNCYQFVVDKIDEINDQASLLNDAIRKAVDIPWLMIGMAKPDDDDNQFTEDNRDDIKAMWVTPREGAIVDAKPLVSNLNIADTVVSIEKLNEDLERDLPELSMHNMRMSGDQTAPGVKAQFNDAIDRFQEAQGNYDDGLSRALSMNVAIAGFRRYEGFEGYNLTDYTKGNMDFYIKPRPIIDDELSKSEKITFLMGSNAPDRSVWKELGIAEDDITKWEAEAKQAQEDMMLAMDVTPAPAKSGGFGNAQANAVDVAKAAA